MDIAFWLSAAVFVVTAAGVGATYLGIRRLGDLAGISPMLSAGAPLVSIIVPARNEADGIEPALRSLLALDYPSLEVVVIDDRSTDATGAIMDRIAAGYPSLQVVHLQELPDGWLGKNHALHIGASRARGEYLLFTDADVHYEATALARAMSHCRARDLDHLTIFPGLPMRSPFLQCGAIGGVVGLFMLYQPWRARETGRHGIGVGAFNLVRAATYRRLGGHAAIAMEIIDDIELGRLMGEGGTQDLLLEPRLVSVEIYRNSLEMLRGVQKNMFAFLRYSAWVLLGATVGMLVFSVWPWIGLFAAEGRTRALNAGSVICAVALHVHVARRFGYGWGWLPFLPLNPLVTIVLFWQIAIVTWIRGGVTWRGTLYPLAELRRRKRK